MTLDVEFYSNVLNTKILFSKRQNYSGREQISGCQGLRVGMITKGQHNRASWGDGKFCTLICAGGGPTDLHMC